MNFSAGVRSSCIWRKPRNTHKTVYISTCIPYREFLKVFTTGFILIELVHNVGEVTLNRVAFRVTSDDLKKIQYYDFNFILKGKKLNHIFFYDFDKRLSE